MSGVCTVQFLSDTVRLVVYVAVYGGELWFVSASMQRGVLNYIF